MKVSKQDIPTIKRNLHLKDRDLCKLFGLSESGIKQARFRFGLFRPPSGNKKKDMKIARRSRTMRIKGNFEWPAGQRYEDTNWLNIII